MERIRNIHALVQRQTYSLNEQLRLPFIHPAVVALNHSITGKAQTPEGNTP
ncbi:hypothetical protein GK091_26750 [Spirosoma agri]|uniref:Uncharacterized protein n=1 Tax=Spirosoma agri TaxID=1987381 RepID=A0A6M0IR00_9BACT|nr:hypothetical protein [Spirosoma agri]